MIRITGLEQDRKSTRERWRLEEMREAKGKNLDEKRSKRRIFICLCVFYMCLWFVCFVLAAVWWEL